MVSFVLDASVTATWFFDDERRPETDAVQARLALETARVPAIWPFEVGNILRLGVKRGRLDEPGRRRHLFDLTHLLVDVDAPPTGDRMHEIMRLADVHGLTFYDAAYLELCLLERRSLATRDQALRRAALDSGVTLVLA